MWVARVFRGETVFVVQTDEIGDIEENRLWKMGSGQVDREVVETWRWKQNVSSDKTGRSGHGVRESRSGMERAAKRREHALHTSYINCIVSFFTSSSRGQKNEYFG